MYVFVKVGGGASYVEPTYLTGTPEENKAVRLLRR